MSQEVQIIAGVLVLSQLVQAFLTFHNARKEATKPIEELKEADAKQVEEIVAMKRDITLMKEDINHAFDKERALEQNNLVLERGMLALLNHALTGNNEEEMENAKASLEKMV